MCILAAESGDFASFEIGNREGGNVREASFDGVGDVKEDDFVFSREGPEGLVELRGDEVAQDENNGSL